MIGERLVVLKYLSREIVFTTSGIVVLLVLILMSAQVVKLLERAVTGDISVEMVLTLATTQVPILLELIVPLGATLGVLLTFGRLKEDSELAVMHAGGYSRVRLFVLASIPCVCIALFVAFISMFLTPTSNVFKEKQKQMERELTVFDTIQPGRFQTDREGRLLFAESLSKDRSTLLKVFIADAQDKQQTEFRYVFADRAIQEVQEAGKFLILFHGRQYRGNPVDHTWDVTEFERYLIRINPSTALRANPLAAQPTASLVKAFDPRSQAELAWRLSVPLVCLVMLPLVFLMARGSHRVNRFVWVIPVILIQFAYVSALMTARQSAYEGAVWMQYASIHGAFLLLALALVSATSISLFRSRVST